VTNRVRLDLFKMAPIRALAYATHTILARPIRTDTLMRCMMNLLPDVERACNQLI
jgi:hypothetical protein